MDHHGDGWPAAADHPTLHTTYDGHASLFECLVPGCGHRVVLDHPSGRLTVLERGADPTIRHTGATAAVGLSVEPPSDDPSRAA